MPVQAINTQNNQTLTPTLGVNTSQRARGKDISFGAIYNVSNAKFTTEQNKVVTEIIDALRKPMESLDNNTPESYYKAKNKLDFIIDNYNQYNDSISLAACRVKKKLPNNMLHYSDEEFFRIGIYDPTHKFDVYDIDTGLTKHKKERNEIFWNNMLTLLLVPMFGLMVYTGYKADNSLHKEKPLVENIDSVANKAKSVLPDTTAVNKAVNTKVLKAIKK